MEVAFGIDGEVLAGASLNYSVRRLFVDEFYFREVALLPQGSRVLDLGGHRVGKRGRFDIDRYELEVTYVNVSSDKHPHVLADAAHLPFGNECFDAVVCSELVEHVRDPVAVLREIHRVCRAGGPALLCAPFLHPIHGDPMDFGRYTDSWWETALSEVGFQDIRIAKNGLFWCVGADMLRGWLYHWVGERERKGPRTVWLVDRIARFACARAVSADAAAASREDAYLASYTTGFSIRAVKE